MTITRELQFSRTPSSLVPASNKHIGRHGYGEHDSAGGVLYLTASDKPGEAVRALNILMSDGKGDLLSPSPPERRLSRLAARAARKQRSSMWRSSSTMVSRTSDTLIAFCRFALAGNSAPLVESLMPSILNTCRPRPRNSIPRSLGPIVLRPVSRRVRPMEMSCVTAERTSETANMSELNKRPGPPSALDITLAYHERTKHHPGRFAPALGYMDWATQPDPFRRFAGAPLLSSRFRAGWDRSLATSRRSCSDTSPQRRSDRRSVSQLFQDALALSAWKQAGSARWSLRVNPSSGNLHPTEGYLVAGPDRGSSPRPAVYHYAPFDHALELRAELSDEAWAALARQLPERRRPRRPHVDPLARVLEVRRASLPLLPPRRRSRDRRLRRGCRGARLGGAAARRRHRHAIWRVLLGVDAQTGIEAEHADCLLAIFPQERGVSRSTSSERSPFRGTVRDELRAARWSGRRTG